MRTLPPLEPEAADRRRRSAHAALLAEALEMRGACVRASASAREAQQTLAAWHPDLMISDVGMPRENGYELIRHVRDLPAEEGGSTPAIACTGYARAEDRARAMNAGFDAVVAKPVDLDAVVADDRWQSRSAAVSGGSRTCRRAHVAGVRDPGAGAAAAGFSAEALARRSAPDS